MTDTEMAEYWDDLRSEYGELLVEMHRLSAERTEIARERRALARGAAAPLLRPRVRPGRA